MSERTGGIGGALCWAGWGAPMWTAGARLYIDATLTGTGVEWESRPADWAYLPFTDTGANAYLYPWADGLY